MRSGPHHWIDPAEAGRLEELYGDLRRGLKLVEFSLLGIQDVTRGSHINAEDLVPIIGFVMDLQEKFEHLFDLESKMNQAQPA